MSNQERKLMLKRRVVSELKDMREVGLIDYMPDNSFIDDLVDFLLEEHIEAKLDGKWVVLKEGKR